MTNFEQIALIEQWTNEAIEKINKAKQEAIAEIERSQEPLPFPIGTPIEAEDNWSQVVLCYYDGIDDGTHTGVAHKMAIGKGAGFPIKIDTARKVGE